MNQIGSFVYSNFARYNHHSDIYSALLTKRKTASHLAESLDTVIQTDGQSNRSIFVEKVRLAVGRISRNEVIVAIHVIGVIAI